ncbi:MAG: hypothetical protein JW717_09215 [Marinilabiliaceae bacterium]|nr:hypothetical protein [Marinilabiliaceae bacterium]
MLEHNTIEKKLSDNIQRFEKIARALNRDRMKFLFHGFTEQQINNFHYELSRLKLIPNDLHYKKKQLKWAEKKSKQKQNLISLCDHFLSETNNEIKNTFKIDFNSLTDKELLHTICSFTEKIRIDNSIDSRIKEQSMQIENDIINFEEAVYNHNESTLLRIRQSIERNNIQNDLINMCDIICDLGKNIWHSINNNNYKDYDPVANAAWHRRKIATEELVR